MLFSPGIIKNLKVKNRAFMSAASEHKADENGTVSREQIAFYEKFAAGGAGLIISIACNVHSTGKSGPRQASIESDENITGISKLAEALHRHECCAVIQFCHSGRWNARYQASVGRKAVAPSYIPDTSYDQSIMKIAAGPYREITGDEIRDLINHYADGAVRAKESGIDAVQIHAAHDSLLSQFLSPAVNHRTDEWGGTPENRMKLHKSIISAIREKLPDFPVFLKLGIQDGFEGGLTFEEGLEAAAALSRCGFDAIETSQGLSGNSFNDSSLKQGINNAEKEAYYRKFSSALKKVSGIPVILSGGIRSLTMSEDILQKEDADFVSFCRPWICESDFINKWQRGESEKSECTSCNQCVMRTARLGESLRCWLRDPEVGAMPMT
ncbi:MAG: NADH:flavin oxidoreductase [Firmicutes bacterium]|nr:NADH:flavin oxidoreductase [Bacillota bacterium]